MKIDRKKMVANGCSKFAVRRQLERQGFRLEDVQLSANEGVFIGRRSYLYRGDMVFANVAPGVNS